MAHSKVIIAQLRNGLVCRYRHLKGQIGGRKFGRLASTTAQFGLEGQHSYCESINQREHEENLGRHGDENFAANLDDKDQVTNQFGSQASDDNPCLYDEHIPTTVLQKGLLAMGSAFMSFYDPYRDDMVATLGEVTGHYALQRLRDKMLADAEGTQILDDRPRINTRTVDMDCLASLPQGTLGREYVDFMKRNRITSDSRTPVHFVDDPDLAYVMQRYREIHDFNHALLGMPATMLGEVTVKWFEMINTRLPMTALGAMFGPLRVKRRHIGKLTSLYIPWVVQAAPRAKLLLNIYFEKRWEQPMAELCGEIGIKPFTEYR
ncbi:ubiquinone biosynthesis protein COQ4 homolog, mitochondrial-like [Acanthaster planci]|uniref:Ubiquinone biosynthesis protein COQ4 homolog, mitochondrial n=1 Tax=Acanthaster planci TaxID=133434 RepID=A0A8B7ZMB9_ACAPL|nr:ubiquinone biosynthesis protein COQ4 homolog, mitochondrial-like [Acanthaster planci]